MSKPQRVNRGAEQRWRMVRGTVLALTVFLFCRGGAGAQDSFRPVLPGERIALDGMLRSQADYGLEWWYVTGHLKGKNGSYGFEAAFFRVGMPVETAQDAFATGNVYLAHFALTDVTKESFVFYERSSRGAFGEAGASVERFHVWMRNWSLEEGEGGAMNIRLDASEHHVELALFPVKPPVAHGEDGYSRKGDDPREASFYVSWPRLRASGWISVPGAGRIAVTGTAWMDREITTPVESAQVAAWDWFGIQMDDGTDIMVYRMLDRDGNVSKWSGGTWVDREGRGTALAPEDFDLRPVSRWESSRSGVRYDTVWELGIRDRGLRLRIAAVLENQELVTFRSTGNAYWEGKCSVEGYVEGRPAGGRAYVEMNRWQLRETRPVR